MKHPKYTPEEIHYMDAGVFTLGHDELRMLISEVFSHLPGEIIDRVMNECLMILLTAKEQGCYLPEYLIRGKALVLFPETLLSEDPGEATRTILHETAHHVLGHRTPLSEGPDFDYHAQEQEAWTLVEEWIRTS